VQKSLRESGKSGIIRDITLEAMMRVLRWSGGLAVVAWAVLFVVLQLAGHELPTWFGIVPVAVLVVLVVATVIVDQLPTDGGRLRSSLRPVMQGLDDAQGIQLGRPPRLEVTYGSDEPQVAELVVPNPDPFADGGAVHVSRPPSGDGGRPEG
jgi:hypothetical protein